ncbi:MAG: enoyl-CoA hydratase/isomerase family protein [Bacteroidetes bacterium]|nr:enoyl-CoA hydratase/isomerase family protein [Bacteroidota bacterium]
MKEFQTIKFECSASIGIIWLNRPDIHNAFNDVMIAELTDCFLEIEKMKDIRLVILRGNGKSFCAGADLNYMKGIAKFGYKENYEDGKKLARLFTTVYNCSCPTLAVVHGACFGGANGLIAACDIVIAEENTKFAFSEVKLGIAPATIGPFVLKRTGEFKGKELMMTGRRFTGKEAEKAGLVNRMVTENELEDVVTGYIKEFKSAAPGAVKATKEMIVKVMNEGGSGITEYTADLIAGLRASDEGQEGMAAFLEKRKADWNR